MRKAVDCHIQAGAVGPPVTLADRDRAKTLVCDGVDVSVRDVVHVAVMLGNDVRRIATVDTACDRVEAIERVALG